MFKKTIGRTTLRYDEFLTVLREVEMTINSRTIVAIYDDSLEEAITPNHLLLGRKLNQNNVEINEVSIKFEPTRQANYLQIILTHFWNRWSSEYITSLREFEKRKRMQKTIREPKLNDIVIVKDEKLPRQQWRVGRVIELLSSRDNKVRAVKVLLGKTRNIIERPINLLYPLECDVEQDELTAGVKNRIRRQAAIEGEANRRTLKT